MNINALLLLIEIFMSAKTNDPAFAVVGEMIMSIRKCCTSSQHLREAIVALNMLARPCELYRLTVGSVSFPSFLQLSSEVQLKLAILNGRIQEAIAASGCGCDYEDDRWLSEDGVLAAVQEISELLNYIGAAVRANVITLAQASQINDMIVDHAGRMGPLRSDIRVKCWALAGCAPEFTLRRGPIPRAAAWLEVLADEK